MSDDVHASVRFRDAELVEALETAEEEHGSRSEAIRKAVATAYSSGDDAESSNDTGLPVKARDAHQKLVDWAGIGGRLELNTAESVLANHLNIQKEAVRKVAIQPLKANNAVALHQGLHEVTLVVGHLDGSEIEATESAALMSSGEAVADGGEASDRLDELAEAGAEVADGA
jgi:hypothetical protein